MSRGTRRATSVDVILERHSDSVLLIVEDDGVGFEAETPSSADGGFGLLGMQERAALVGATLEIESSAGQGHDRLASNADAAQTQPSDHA